MFESLLKTQVQNVMDILGQQDGLAPEHTYVQVNSSSYDPATGTVMNSETTYTDVPMVLASYTSEEIDDDKIVTTDQKAIIAANDLPVVPKVQDRIVLSDGTDYMVMDFNGVPGESLWIVQIRETD
jgi:hypothetical protein